MKFKVAGIVSRSRRHISSRFATDGLPESSCTQKTFDRAFKELSNGMFACRTRSNGIKLFKINEAVRMARRLWRAVDLWNVFDFYENGAETQPFETFGLGSDRSVAVSTWNPSPPLRSHQVPPVGLGHVTSLQPMPCVVPPLLWKLRTFLSPTGGTLTHLIFLKTN